MVLNRPFVFLWWLSGMVGSVWARGGTFGHRPGVCLENRTPGLTFVVFEDHVCGDWFT